MKEIYRILDANFNRAREALRVAEDCGRFAMNDPAISAMAKTLRSDLKAVLDNLPADQMITSRDTPGDVGTTITSPAEQDRKSIIDVAMAACKRLTEALRTIEEYTKVLAPSQSHCVERMRYDAYTLEQRIASRLLLSSKLSDMKLYMLVTSTMLSANSSMLTTVRQAIAGGVDAVQLRETDTTDAKFLAYAAELRELTDEMGKLLLINNRVDIAAMVSADGVHLGQYDLPIASARKLLRPGAIIGKTTHSIEQARHAQNEGADYISVGPMFETQTKPQSQTGPVVGTALLRQVKKEISRPVVAIGGITTSNASEVIQAGGDCIAICGQLCKSQSPQSTAGKFRTIIEKIKPVE